MTSVGRGYSNRSSSAAAIRKKRRTIGAFRAHAMGESFDCHHSAEASGNFSLGIVPEDELGCTEGEEGTGSENIVVAVRVRPLSAEEVAEGKRSCCDVLSSNTLVIRKGADPGAYLRSQKGSANDYSFDAVFAPEAGQSEVYQGTAKPHIPALLEGVNVTVFAYGATGAGKTHTMMGSERARREGDPEEVSGIVPQSLVELFRLLEERGEAGNGRGKGETETWSVRAGYLQVYNEQIMDLLSSDSKPLKINEDPGKGIVVVAGLREMEVTSSEEILELLRQGNANRRTEATAANQVSSRSHAVLQVVVVRTLVDDLGSKSVRESKLSLIDLAGSERASATNNRGEQLRQGANINKSLLSLANCINALSGNRRRRGGKGAGNVKYRDSKLTHLLKTSLEGKCRLVMIANVNPSHVFFDDSHNTLKYANRAKNIKVDPRVTEAVRGTSGMMTEKEARLVKEFQALKERNQQMEAQLESMRNSRERIEPDPAGFADLFAPNTSSIMSVESSTPQSADADPSNSVPQLPTAPGSGEAGFEKTSSSRGGDRDSGENRGGIRASGNGGGASGVEMEIDEGSTMPPPQMPRGGHFGAGSPAGQRSGSCTGETGTSCAPGSGSKRKRDIERRDESDERARLRAALAAERLRVREMEDKVRELECSMARMGAQQDVNMELIDTFRHQKETAEEAARAERATADDLLEILKDKEAEIANLRKEITELSRTAVSRASSSVSGIENKSGQIIANSSNSRPGLALEGGSPFGPLRFIQENRAGDADVENGDPPHREHVGVACDLSRDHSSNRCSAFDVNGGTRRTDFSPSPSMRSAHSTLEVASAITSRRRNTSMIPRARKSMIPAPSSSGRSSRRLGDLTNSSSTRLSGHLGKATVTPLPVKKIANPGTDPIKAHSKSNNNDVGADLGPGRSESRYGKRTRRVSSRTGVTPQQSSVAGRTRSRLTMAPGCALRDVR